MNDNIYEGVIVESDKHTENDNDIVKPDTSIVSNDNPKYLSWNPTIDKHLAKLCDRAKCFSWMHNETCNIYKRKSRIFLIITNLLTAISGILNIIVKPDANSSFQPAWIFGTFSIFTSTINLLQDKLAYQQYALLHEKFAGDWSVIISKIEEIIIIPYESRKDCKTFLRYIKNDINQLSIAGNSKLPNEVRKLCYEKFKNIPNFDVPDICGQIEHTNYYNEL